MTDIDDIRLVLEKGVECLERLAAQLRTADVDLQELGRRVDDATSGSQHPTLVSVTTKIEAAKQAVNDAQRVVGTVGNAVEAYEQSL